MKVGMYVAVLILAIGLVAGCSSKGTFGEKLESKNVVLVKGEKFENTITDEKAVSDLVSVLNNSKAIDPPAKAKGIKPEVAEETVLIKFPKADFFYIGDGYLYYGNEQQYYSVSTDIEAFTTDSTS